MGMENRAVDLPQEEGVFSLASIKVRVLVLLALYRLCFLLSRTLGCCRVNFFFFLRSMTAVCCFKLLKKYLD